MGKAKDGISLGDKIATFLKTTAGIVTAITVIGSTTATVFTFGYNILEEKRIANEHIASVEKTVENIQYVMITVIVKLIEKESLTKLSEDEWNDYVMNKYEIYRLGQKLGFIPPVIEFTPPTR